MEGQHILHLVNNYIDLTALSRHGILVVGEEDATVELKDKKLMIKMSKAEKSRLTAYSRKNHLNVSALVRALIAEYLDEAESRTRV